MDRLTFLQLGLLQPYIGEWKRLQQLSANGYRFENGIGIIQDACELQTDRIYECMFLKHRLCEVISSVDGRPSTLIDICSQEEGRLRTLLGALICASTVVEEQPPQVIRTNMRFSTTLRMLLGGRLMNSYISPPAVTVSIINEEQACALLRNGNCELKRTSGEIRNNHGVMKYDGITRSLSLPLRFMSLTKIRRAAKNGRESVLDEKFCLLYEFSVDIGQSSIAVRCQSLPVTVIVHAKQEADASAVIIWDNAFSQPQRLPFVVPEVVAWTQMAEVLSTKFRSEAGRGLFEKSLHVLATKAFRDPGLPVDCGDRQITWAQFCKDLLPGRAFSFWAWFYAALKVTREHLKEQWSAGLVFGFIGRPETEAILLTKPNGTFLLRFSESELGGVSIAWVSECDGRKSVHMVQPFTAKDLKSRSISDRISDYPVS